MGLHDLQINKSSLVPLYEQLRQGLVDAIISGKIPAGSKMPTEEELCDTFAISRPVVRQAYSQLIANGYVVRLRGRGTFVKMPDVRESLFATSFNFSEEMRKHGLNPVTKLLQIEQVTYVSRVYEKLKLKEGEICWHMARLRCVNDHPYVYLENWVPDRIIKNLGDYDLNNRSLYEIFNTEYKIQTTRTKRTLAARIASVETAALLGERRGIPVMFVENLTFDQFDRPVDWCEEYYDGREHKFEYDVFNH